MFERLKKGFTLIEMLIVVAIIATLLLMFLPKGENAIKDSSRVSSSLTGKNLETQITDYYMNNNSFPVKSGTPDTTKAKMVIDSVLDKKGLDKSDYSKYGFSYIDAKALKINRDISKFFMGTSGGLEGVVFSEDGKLDSKGNTHSGSYFIGSSNLNTPKIITNGLVAYWNSKQGINGSTWNNIAPVTLGQYNGTVNGATLQIDGFYFDGTNDTINISGTLPYSGTTTIDCWLKVPSVNYQGNVFGSDNYTYWLGFQTPGGQPYYDTVGFTPTYNMPANTLTHIVITNDVSSVVSLYINGAFISSSVAVPFPYYDSGIFTIGNATGNTTSYFNGTISSLKIYNKILTPSEIAQNYSVGKEVGL